MTQQLPLERRFCARNAGVAIVARVSIQFFMLIALNTLFLVPGDSEGNKIITLD